MKDSPKSVWLLHEGNPHRFASAEEAQAFLDTLPSRVGIEFVQAPLLIQLLNAPGAPLSNWTDVINEVFAEFERASTSEYRASLLEVFTSVMDLVENSIAGEVLEKFRTARTQQYKLLIVMECTINDNVSVEDLHEVTGREIAAGRMPPDHSLQKLAEQAMAAPHLSRQDLLQGAAGNVQPGPEMPEPSSPPSVWQRLLTALRLR